MHTLKLLLKTTKEDDIFIESVYRAVADVHNILVSEGKKRLRMLSRDKRYQYAKTHYGEAAAEVHLVFKSLKTGHMLTFVCHRPGR